MSKATDSEITRFALELLADGLLPSFLPIHLMRQFGISRDRAQRLASEALQQFKVRTDD